MVPILMEILNILHNFLNELLILDLVFHLLYIDLNHFSILFAYVFELGLFFKQCFFPKNLILTYSLLFDSVFVNSNLALNYDKYKFRISLFTNDLFIRIAFLNHANLCYFPNGRELANFKKGALYQTFWYSFIIIVI